jgi:hypothetical protein
MVGEIAWGREIYVENLHEGIYTVKGLERISLIQVVFVVITMHLLEACLLLPVSDKS